MGIFSNRSQEQNLARSIELKLIPSLLLEPYVHSAIEIFGFLLSGLGESCGDTGKLKRLIHNPHWKLF